MSFYMLKRLLSGDDHDDHGAETEHHDDHNGVHAGHDDHDDHEEEEGMDVDTFKWIMLVAMLLCIGFGLIPKVWSKCRDSENTLSLLNCFSAGLFLGMSLIHMMPEAAEMYTSWAAKEGIERAFPLPFVMYFVGYLLILAIDRVAAKAYHKATHGQKNTEGSKVEQVASSERESIQLSMVKSSTRDPMTAGEVGALPKAHTNDNKVAPQGVKEVEKEGTSETVSKTSAIILVLAIGFHAFFEGIAFGLQTSIESAG